MKKISSFFLLIFISMFLWAADVRDGYIYGNLEIAYNNELPSGLFAKAQNYLPGDTIRISNPFSGEELSVLNLGTLDSGRDSALVLTTEAAGKLGIDFSEPLYVKISSRTDDYDDIAVGTAMLTRSKKSSEPVASAEASKPSPSPIEEIASVPEPVVEPEPEPVVEPAVEQPSEPVMLPKEETVADLSGLEEAPVAFAAPEPKENLVQPAPSATPADNTVAEPEPVVSESAVTRNVKEQNAPVPHEEPLESPVFVEESAAVKAAPEVTEPVALAFAPVEEESVAPARKAAAGVADSPAQENVPVTEEKVSSPARTVREVASATKKEEPVVQEEAVRRNTAKTVASKTAAAPAEKQQKTEETPLVKTNQEKTVRPEKSAVPEKNPVSQEKTVRPVEQPVESVAAAGTAAQTSTEDFNDEDYDTIIEKKEVITLVPVDDKEPPEKGETKAEKKAEETEVDGDYDLVYSEEQHLTLVPTGNNEPPAAEYKTNAVPVSEEKHEDSCDVEDGDIIVEKRDVLVLNPVEAKAPDGDGNCTGAASADSNVAPVKTVKEKDLREGSYYVQVATALTEADVDKIVGKYKKYPFVKVPFEKKDGYKIMVGPLTNDEKGAILAKFKSFGFKDAFVRKIK